MKCARVELLVIALWLAPVAAAPDPAPDLELLEFLGDADEIQQTAEAELDPEAEPAPPQPQPRSEEPEVPERNDP
jgi:hypothetical protein